MKPILVTGSRGLIGSSLVKRLREGGNSVVTYDVLDDPQQNVLLGVKLRERLVGCRGVVHLAAVSRVLHGQMDPELCRWTNVFGTQFLAEMAGNLGKWVVYASSREVYGKSKMLPVTEEQLLNPCNIYARTKAEAENIVGEHVPKHAILRFSNVYGELSSDHPDRVVPWFMASAKRGNPMVVHGARTTLDFVHLSDVVNGILLTILALDAGQKLEPMHLATGVGTKLSSLARLCNEVYDSKSPIIVEKGRSYDVEAFYGSYERAQRQIGWSPKVALADGLRLMKET